MTLRRQDRWSSKQEAEIATRKMFKAWDPRVTDIYLQKALREDPSSTTGSNQKKGLTPVTLVTPRYQELVNYIRPLYIYDRCVTNPKIEYQTGLNDVYFVLGLITCNTLFVCGGTSSLSTPHIRELWQARTGELSYAKRNSEKRVVDEMIIPNAGHFLPMEAPESCAKALVLWIKRQFVVKEEASEAIGPWMSLSQGEKSILANDWVQSLRNKL